LIIFFFYAIIYFMSKHEYLRPVAVFTTLLALGGCANINARHDSAKDDTRTVLGLEITGNTRHDPGTRDSADGLTNLCYSKNYKVESTTILVTPGDINGPWYGIPVVNLPQEVADSCSDDTDATVWVATNYADIKS
jgi:hypothetical protein